jgi:sporulation protein YlmC with PRC-barrel domain
MMLLSTTLGRAVLALDGEVIGSLGDLTVRIDEHRDFALIERMLVRRRGDHDVLVPWADVAAFALNGIRLSGYESAWTMTSPEDALESGELLLKRDVLDTQIVDIAGQRLARVADVVLAHRTDGRVEVVGVEVGFGAVLRRLGLERLAIRFRPDAVAWTDLHLTSERGHSVQLATPRSAVHLLDARGLALLVTRLDTESAAEVLGARGPVMAADVIRASHPDVGERMLRAMSDSAAAEVVSVMPTGSAAHWRRRLAAPRILRGRRLLRFHVWPRRRLRPMDLRR